MGDEISTDLGQVSDCEVTESINEYADENNVTLIDCLMMLK